MKVIPFNNKENYIIQPPYHTETPVITRRKSLLDKIKVSNEPIFNNNVLIDNQMAMIGKKILPLRTTKEQVFPERYVHKYTNHYKTTTKEDYK